MNLMFSRRKVNSLKFKGGSEVQYVDKQRGISVVLDGSDLKSKKTNISSFLVFFKNFENI